MPDPDIQSLDATVRAYSPQRSVNRPRISNRLSITLPEHVAKQLSERSYQQGRSISNLAAYLIERALETLPTSSS